MFILQNPGPTVASQFYMQHDLGHFGMRLGGTSHTKIYNTITRPLFFPGISKPATSLWNMEHTGRVISTGIAGDMGTLSASASFFLWVDHHRLQKFLPLLAAPMDLLPAAFRVGCHISVSVPLSVSVSNSSLLSFCLGIILTCTLAVFAAAHRDK